MVPPTAPDLPPADILPTKRTAPPMARRGGWREGCVRVTQNCIWNWVRMTSSLVARESALKPLSTVALTGVISLKE
jgi:hypothetical protein